MHSLIFGAYHVGISFHVQFINMSIQDLYEFNKC